MGTDEGEPHSSDTFISISSEWISDSGALRHMTGCAHKIIDSVTIKGNSLVFIPNGRLMHATRIGRVNFGGCFLLGDVLLVSDFK